MSRYFFLNDTIVPAEKAMISVTDLSVLRGYGIFDFFRVINHKAFLLDDYLDRFYASAEMTGLEVPVNRTDLQNIIDELIRKNNQPEAGIRMILTGGNAINSFEVSKPNFAILFEDFLQPSVGYYEKGIKLITYPYKREFSTIKSINYFTVINLRNQIKEHNAADVLYYFDSNVLEVSRSNVFIVSKGKVITPLANILMGVTRKNLIKLASQIFPIEEREVALDEVFSADEIFLTGTTRRVTPVVQIDSSIIGNGKPGKITSELFAMFKTLEEKLTK